MLASPFHRLSTLVVGGKGMRARPQRLRFRGAARLVFRGGGRVWPHRCLGELSVAAFSLISTCFRHKEWKVRMPHTATFDDPGADDWIVNEWTRTGPGAQDPTRALGYTVSRVRQEYAAIMGVMDQAVDHLTPAEIAVELAARGSLFIRGWWRSG